MHRILSLLFKVTSYNLIRWKYPEARKLRFNGYCINIFGGGELNCGMNSYISYFSRVFICAGTKLYIGDNVSIGHNVRIYTSKASTGKLLKTGEKRTIIGDVKIGNNVLIGANVYIGPGVTVPDDVVIGANSVVPKTLGCSGVYSGIPARIISAD